VPVNTPAQKPIDEEQTTARAEVALAWNHPATRLARRNATALAATVGFGIVVLKILSVAQFNTRVAAGLVGTTDSPAVVLAVALYVTPFAFVLFGLTAIELAIRPSHSGLRAASALRAAAIVSFALLLVSVPLIFLLLLLALFPLRASLTRLRRRVSRGGARTKVAGTGPILGSVGEWLVIFGFLPLLVIYSPPWIPVERLEMSGNQVEVAYVVRAESSWTVLLIDRGRSLRYVKTADIVSREPCSTETYTFTLLELLNGSQLPQCYP
jgi:hypothetical protein